MSVVSIKNQVKERLEELKRRQMLEEVVVDDFKLNLNDQELCYPAAILTSPTVEGEYFTSKDNLRLYTFEIEIVVNGEDISDPTEVEELAEAILDEFDQNDTLGGTAIQLEPSTTTPEPVKASDRTFIVFSVILKARAQRPFIT